MNQGNNDIRLLLFIGVAAMLLLFISLLIIFIVSQRKRYEYQVKIQSLREEQQNQLIEAAIRSEEQERHRIAEALHDEVGAFLSSSKLHLQGMQVSQADEHNYRLHQKGKELLDEAIQKVRGISHNLHSNVLQELGLSHAIGHFSDKITLANLIEVTTDLHQGSSTQNPENDISIYRLVQELINNILKHAHAKKIHIRSVYTDDSLLLNIRHDGLGLTQPAFETLRYQKAGLGLKNIQNRLILLKGLIFFSEKEQGYAIDIKIPVNPDSISKP